MSPYERTVLALAVLSVFLSATTVWLMVVRISLMKRQILAQLEAQFYAEYTRRYQEIMMKLPQELVLDRLDLSAIAIPAERERVMGLFRAYIDLCAEEYFLHRTHRLADDVWAHWKSGIEDNFHIRALREVWDDVSSQRDYTELRQFLSQL